MMTMTTTASGAVVGRANARGAMASMRASRGRWTVARGSSSSSSGEKKFRVRCVSIEASRGVGGEGTGDGRGDGMRWDAMGWIARSGAEGGGEGGARGRAGWIRAFWFSKSERAAEGVSETAVEGNRRRETRDECVYD